MQLSLRTDRHLLNTGAPGTRHLMISLTAPTAEPPASQTPHGAAAVVAHEVVLRLTLPGGVEAEPLGRIPFARVGDDLLFDLGDLRAGQELRIVVTLRFPAATRDARATLRARASVRYAITRGEVATCEWRYATDADVESQPRDVISALCSRATDGEARREAWTRGQLANASSRATTS